MSRDKAYTAVITESGKYRLGIAVEGEPGYYKVKEDSDAGGTFDSYDEAQGVAQAYNDGLGITAPRAAEIVASSMGAQNMMPKGWKP